MNESSDRTRQAHAALRPRLAVLTVSDGVAAGTREDVSGTVIEDWIRDHGWTATARDVVTDDADRITAALLACADRSDVDVVITTGGTGLSPRDVTPEATRAIIERDAPGIADRIRAAGNAQTPYAALSRGIAGVRGSTLIVNLPGSTGGVRDGLQVLAELIPHAVQLLRGADTDSHHLPNG